MSDFVRIFLTPHIRVQEEADRNLKGTITVTVTNGAFHPKEEESFVEFLPGNGTVRKNGANKKLNTHRRMRVKAKVSNGNKKLKIACKPIGERGAVYYAALAGYDPDSTKFAIEGVSNLSESDRQPPRHRDIPPRPDLT